MRGCHSSLLKYLPPIQDNDMRAGMVILLGGGRVGMVVAIKGYKIYEYALGSSFCCRDMSVRMRRDMVMRLT